MSMETREVHGVTLRAGAVSRPKIVREADDEIVIEGPIDIRLNVRSARHLARVLYRLARRLEKRLASGIETGTAKTEGLGPKDESPSDAQALPASPDEGGAA